MSDSDPGGYRDDELVALARARVDQLADRIDAVRRRIANAGGGEGSVRVVAVTKTFGPEAVLAALLCGLVDVGENYANELVDKAAVVGRLCALIGVEPPSWHFIGPIQRNKIPRLIPCTSLFESVDRFEVGVALATRAPGAAVLVEVDVTDIVGRPGIAPEKVADLVRRLRDLDLRVEGLMTVAPPGGGEAARRAFATVATLRDELQLKEASMGMSDDLELAVAQGATMVRVGRALFGVRPVGQPVSQ
jgi:pyridoxal phosphate enzyme (YggS family)